MKVTLQNLKDEIHTDVKNVTLVILGYKDSKVGYWLDFGKDAFTPNRLFFSLDTYRILHVAER